MESPGYELGHLALDPHWLQYSILPAHLLQRRLRQLLLSHRNFVILFHTCDLKVSLRILIQSISKVDGKFQEWSALKTYLDNALQICLKSIQLLRTFNRQAYMVLSSSSTCSTLEMT